MNKIVFATFLLLVSFAFISCDSSKKDLKSEIEKVKDECPLDLGMVGEISSINYDEETDEVVMTMTINKDLPLKLSALKQLKNTMKRTVLGNMAKSESNMTLMEKIASADAEFTIVMQTAETNESLKIRISTEEVKDISAGNIDPITPREMLEIMVVSTNAQCPIQIDKVMTLSSVSLEKDNFVYNYSLDENTVSVESIEGNKDVLKANIKKLLLSGDPMMQELIRTCKEANVSILYRYIGDISGDVCIVKISSEEF